MPIILPQDLPAKSTLSKENIFVMDKQRASHQDIRPLKIGIVNLMPDKITTETQLLRMLSNSPLQVEIDLITMKSHRSKNVSAQHLEKFYTTFEKIKDHKYDGLIVTGAPVERLDFSQVNYWEELKQIMDYAKEKVYSTLFICWAAQAALNHYYGVPKYEMSEKLFGVFETEVISEGPLTRGFDRFFYAPQSRYTYCKEEDIVGIEDLTVIAKSEEAGLHIVASKDHRLVFVSGHGEYDEETLDLEYKRDVAKGMNTPQPKNYYRNEKENKDIMVRWKSHGHMFFANWLNYCVYQETPYDIEKIERKVVAKFGGSSLADDVQISKAKEIITADGGRSHIVVSAPGKRSSDDQKITDILDKCHRIQQERKEIEKLKMELEEREQSALSELEKTVNIIEERFEEICRNLSISGRAQEEIRKTKEEIKHSEDRDYILSRGEYLNAIVVSEYLGYEFVDAQNIIFFKEDGSLDEKRTGEAIKKHIDKDKKVVVPGFYGIDANGKIRTFQRGGSDITGSILASALGVDLYENWTDVNGVMTADPRQFEDAQTIAEMTYEELLQITKNGAQVYHPDAIKPVMNANIPIQIKNTNRPQEEGTLVKSKMKE